MPFDNGSGSGGGNGSVWWSMTHGSRTKPAARPPALANALQEARPKQAAGGPGALGTAAPETQITNIDQGLRGVLGNRAIELDVPDGPPGAGQVKLGLSVEGHDDTEFEQIGRPDHPGKFRVQLRFRKVDLENPALISSAEREWIEKNAKPIDGLPTDSVYLVIDVPAIRRDPPAGNAAWPDMPWEIHWGW